jgi:hypothetical protein
MHPCGRSPRGPKIGTIADPRAPWPGRPLRAVPPALLRRWFRSLRRQLLAPPSTCSRASTPSGHCCPAAFRAAGSMSRFGRRVSDRRSRSVLVVSHHLDGFLRPGPSRNSVHRVAGLLHPAADPGVRCVSLVVAATIARRLDHVSPQRGSHPLEKSPHHQPFRIAAAVAPSPLLRRIAAVSLDLEALLWW